MNFFRKLIWKIPIKVLEDAERSAAIGTPKEANTMRWIDIFWTNTNIQPDPVLQIHGAHHQDFTILFLKNVSFDINMSVGSTMRRLLYFLKRKKNSFKGKCRIKHRDKVPLDPGHLTCCSSGCGTKMMMMQVHLCRWAERFVKGSSYPFLWLTFSPGASPCEICPELCLVCQLLLGPSAQHLFVQIKEYTQTTAWQWLYGHSHASWTWPGYQKVSLRWCEWGERTSHFRMKFDLGFIDAGKYLKKNLDRHFGPCPITALW